MDSKTNETTLPEIHNIDDSDRYEERQKILGELTSLQNELRARIADLQKQDTGTPFGTSSAFKTCQTGLHSSLGQLENIRQTCLKQDGSNTCYKTLEIKFHQLKHECKSQCQAVEELIFRAKKTVGDQFVDNRHKQQSATSQQTPVTYSPYYLTVKAEVAKQAAQPLMKYRLKIYPCPDASQHIIDKLFQHVRQLSAMDKKAMSGRCEAETKQMENFLERQFDFKNIPKKYIVDGVRDFQLQRSIKQFDPKDIIHFPSNTPPSFEMTVQEILAWQQSYAVYAPKAVSDITKSFLEKALQGKTSYGLEAFLMKFVVRISTCPILMEFDAKVIPRRLTDDWPNRIKLVSVTGVDFACRKHDLDDIRTYIRNWQQVFELHPKHGVPICPNGRDFVVRHGAPPVDLDETRLFQDLKMMARVRLHACDQQKVQIVVETGIGLGVFAGSYIGIDDRVRKLSAKAVREVLETDGGYFTNILAVVFALPIFPSKSDPNGYETSVYKAFIEEFSTSKYHGPVPVMMADQDMHRLAVSIAKFGYYVSELNPADSHGVFGEYWQNRGPAVEEKLALTTLGLLVQHHRINPCVLDQNNYHLIPIENLQ